MAAEVQDDQVTATYLRGINLISQDVGYDRFYYQYNAHGDVVTLTDQTGSVSKSYDYTAFGIESDPDADDENPFRYCGEYFDSETGTYYLRARYYDPSIGRFTQPDSHWNSANRIYGDDPQKINEREDALGNKLYSYSPEISAIVQSGNLYAYCANNPISYVDPTGERLVFPGQIHNLVIAHILLNNEGLVAEQTVRLNISAEVINRYPGVRNKFKYNRSGRGRVDLFDPKSGQIWEVKRNTPDQIMEGHFNIDMYLCSKLPYKTATTLIAGTDKFYSAFTTNVNGSIYTVTYRSVGHGVVAYDYHELNPERAYETGDVTDIILFLLLVSAGAAAVSSAGAAAPAYAAALLV